MTSRFKNKSRKVYREEKTIRIPLRCWIIFWMCLLPATLVCRLGLSTEVSPKVPERKTSSTKATPNTPTKAAPNSLERRPYDVSTLLFLASAGVTSEGYSISSSEGSMNMPRKLGTYFGGEFRYNPERSAYSFRFRLMHLSTTYRGLSIVSPSEITVGRRNISAVAFLRPNFVTRLRMTDLFEVGLGYFLLSRSATSTTPIAIINSSSQSGICLIGSYIGRVATHRYEISIEMGLPHRFSEDGTRTGYYSSGLSGELGGKYIYPYNDQIDLSGGLHFRHESISFKGKGDRGLTDPSESSFTIIVPVEVRLKF